MDKAALKHRFKTRTRGFAGHAGAKVCLGAIAVILTTVVCSFGLSASQFQAYKAALAMIVGIASVFLVFGYAWAMASVLQKDRQAKNDSTT